MDNRDNIIAISEEHAQAKERASAILKSNKKIVKQVKANFMEFNILSLSEIDDKNLENYTKVMNHIQTYFNLIANMILDKDISGIIEKIDFYVLDKKTIWCEVYTKNDRLAKSRFFGMKYRHITVLRTILSSYAGKTGLFVILGLNN